jgi:cytochrome c oxidase cbb3-type subunit 1
VNAAITRAVRRHSMGWLVAANAVGLLLAVLLLWPGLNDPLAPLTYGRWMPLHLNWQLYGWCALPLVGVLYRFYLPDDDRAAFAARFALGCWTAGLLFGGLTWLAGRVSGKAFLDWNGAARSLWTLAGLVLWLVLLRQAGRRNPRLPGWAWALLIALGAVPFVLYWAAGPGVYPAVNPDSGGPTGASLLGSTLGVIAIFGLLPWLLRLERVAGTRAQWSYAGAFALSLLLYAGLGKGNTSHRQTEQIAGLGSLAVWIPLVWFYARSFVWAPATRSWLAAAFAWWLLLVLTGWIGFLPGFSERVKFTNVLVAHAHLALAGLVTSLHVALLLQLGPGRAPRAGSFWLWQLGCAAQLVALFWLGWRESAEPALLYGRGGPADLAYGLRLLGGGAMFAASVDWWRTFSSHATT